VPSQVTNITDLDLLLGEPRNVRLGGIEYKLPADCSVELYLMMVEFAQLADPSQADEASMLRPLRDGTLELFQVHQPALGRLPAALGLEGLMTLIGQVYASADDPTPPPEGEQEPAAADTTTKPKPTSKRKAAAKAKPPPSSTSSAG
jgi:hypothetical protein